MPANSTVDVTLTPQVKNGQTKWQMQIPGGQSGGYGAYPTISLPRGHQGDPTDAHLVFTIANPPGSTWKFAKDANALWVTSQANDPSAPSTDPHVPVGSIHTQNPNPSNPATADTQLTFTDNNGGNAVTLHYTLNFVNGSQKSSTLDPIIQNGGCCMVSEGPGFGGTALSSTSFIAYIALAFVVGVVVTLVVQRLMRRV
jgi:hypothetical protein